MQFARIHAVLSAAAAAADSIPSPFSALPMLSFFLPCALTQSPQTVRTSALSASNTILQGKAGGLLLDMARKRRASEAIEEEEQQVVVDSDQDAGGVGAAEDDDEVLDVVDDSDEELEKEMRALGMLPAPAEATKRPPKLDAGGLARRLEQIAVTLQGSAHYLPFIETLCVVADQPMPSVDANDDFAREKALCARLLLPFSALPPAHLWPRARPLTNTFCALF